MTLKELRQAVADLATQGRAKTDEYNKLLAKLRKLEAEGADVPEADTAALTALGDEVGELEGQLTAAKQALADAEVANDRARLFAEPEAPRRSARSLFTAEADPRRTFGFRSLGEFARSVHAASAPGSSAKVDERLLGVVDGVNAAPTNYHQERGGSAGEGYHVPPAYRESVYELVFGEPDLLTMVDREPTESNSVKMIRDETTPWGASGVQAYWRNEAGQMSASKMADKEVTVDLHQLYAFVLATDELLMDAPRLSARLGKQAARAINWKASESIVSGTGVGQPQGYFGHASEVVVAKESGQTADTIVAANVLKMYARQLNPGRGVWLAHQSTIPQLATMTIGDQPVWTPPSTGLQGAPGGMLLGRPIILSNHCEVVGDKGDLQFIDPMGFYCAEKGSGIAFAESAHLYFDYGMQAFRWTFRMGGRPLLSAPVSPAKGSDTLSTFVQLAARA